ncbi:MAG: bifunctional UDP-N-acetylmuramoyl-tripeptide:D-alanyl-D-alanine ligase/alanine racemase [Bacteroidales bacterium]|jgi:alanine racemase|nr:bifunctional UDP-N-acetylmuramoyl-tripeptide:D-alanyl-D-alanine ligase/alanine racemase [Bacteroidales bacterium]
MKVTLSTIIRKIECSTIGKIKDFEVKILLYDSRKLTIADKTLFFAIQTSSNNGEKYIDSLYKKGVLAFVVKNPPKNISYYKDAIFIVVDDVVKAMQDIAKIKRDKFKNDVLAITGSNGKTIVKDWICQLIDRDMKICQSPRSYNSQIGVPLSLWNLNEDDDLAIIEAGISSYNEMENLERIIKPTIGLITNIGDAHQINFNSIEDKVKEKVKLLENCSKIIYCSDIKIIDDIIKQEIIDKNPKKRTIISWGKNKKAIFRIEKIQIFDKTTTIHYKYNKIKGSFSINFIDKASIENSINAFVASLVLGEDAKKLELRMQLLHSLDMRLQIKEGINSMLIINDSYSSDMFSLLLAIENLKQQALGLQTMAILSDITQSSLKGGQIVEKINSYLEENNIGFLIGIGENFVKYENKIKIKHKTFTSVEQFMENYCAKDFANKIVLIKGARKFHFEKITQFFEKRTHQTQLEINLSSIIDNVNYYKSLLKNSTLLMAMVKANSYGAGGYKVAWTLAKGGANYLAVAFADEGVQLREKGIKLPIMVCSPEKESISKMIQYDLEPEIYSLSILNDVIEQINTNIFFNKKRKLKIHIKLDTGMHRLGMEEEDIDILIKRIKENKNIVISSIFSHLAASDDEAFDGFTLHQGEKFEKLSNKIMSHFSYPIIRHIANSAAITRFPSLHYDMVRLGIGMYGIGVDEKEQEKLKYVHRLRTIITQIRNIKKGESVGYNRKFIAKKDMTIGVIPIGYADGFSRRRGNGKGRVLINGKLAKVIGSVCMDMAIVDLTNIDCKETDEVIIFSENYPVTNIAKELKTIPYEVFTTISPRIERVFYQQ